MLLQKLEVALYARKNQSGTSIKPDKKSHSAENLKKTPFGLTTTLLAQKISV